MRVSLLALALALAACGASDHSDGGMDAAAGGPDLGDCPNYNPSSGSGGGGTCAHPDEYCTYFEAYCHCNVHSGNWYCCDDGVRQLCPPAPPSGPDCCRAFPPCTYACVGGVATTCTCTDDRWECTTSACP